MATGQTGQQQRQGAWGMRDVSMTSMGSLGRMHIAAYMVKVELQAKVDSLDKDIEFLKRLYDAVSAHLSPAFLPLQLKAHDLPKGTPAGGTQAHLRHSCLQRLA